MQETTIIHFPLQRDYTFVDVFMFLEVLLTLFVLLMWGMAYFFKSLNNKIKKHSPPFLTDRRKASTALILTLVFLMFYRGQAVLGKNIDLVEQFILTQTILLLVITWNATLWVRSELYHSTIDLHINSTPEIDKNKIEAHYGVNQNDVI